jgi:hypothetical protein
MVPDSAMLTGMLNLQTTLGLKLTLGSVTIYLVDSDHLDTDPPEKAIQF